MKSILSLAIKSIWHRRMATVLTVVSISLSVALFVGVAKTKEAVRDAFSGAISRVDLIVGPRTGTTSLLLYSVFHVGSPTHTVSMRSVEYARSLAEVDWVVPFSLGDGFKGFPVVGTEKEFFNHYKVRDRQDIEFAVGKSFSVDNEAVIGSEVAQTLALTVGSKIVLSHGHTEDGDGFEKHEEHPFSVAGILKVTGTPVDKSVYVSMVGMGEIHRGLIEEANLASEGDQHNDQPHDDDHHHEDGSYAESNGKLNVLAVNGFFLGAKNRMEALNLQRKLNLYEGDALLAILPGMAMAELWKNLGIFERALSIVSFCVVIAGILGLFVSLYILSGQRQREIMVLRAVGAGPGAVFALLAGEAVVLVLAGITVGAGLMYGGLVVLAPWIEKRFSITLMVSGPTFDDFIFAVAMLAVGCIVGILSSMRAYRSAMHEGLGTRL